MSKVIISSARITKLLKAKPTVVEAVVEPKKKAVYIYSVHKFDKHRKHVCRLLSILALL